MLEITVVLSFAYHAAVTCLGVWIAYKGYCKFEASPAKTGEIEAEYKGAKAKMNNAPIGVFFIILGICVLGVGNWLSPKVAIDVQPDGGRHLNIQMKVPLPDEPKKDDPDKKQE
jgi:hypothetical protein